MTRAAPARGIGLVAVILVLVVFAAIAAAVLRLAAAQQLAAGQDVLSLRAQAAARAGIEYGLYQALRGSWTSCSGASTTLDLRSSHGMRVTVGCDSRSYNEGESVPGVPVARRVFTIDAVACNGSAASCPDAAAAVRAGYAERRRQAQVIE